MKEGVGIFSKNRKLTKHIRRLRLLIQRYKDDHGAFVTVTSVEETRVVFMRDGYPHYCWICPYISRHLLSLNPLLACCRRYSRGER
ncbi:DUF4222 domain-containing protein [Escherichia coli]|nr:DUF4222 domain-containing protein [Escherichia coli]